MVFNPLALRSTRRVRLEGEGKRSTTVHPEEAAQQLSRRTRQRFTSPQHERGKCNGKIFLIHYHHDNAYT
jgi:hypothetical protein